MLFWGFTTCTIYFTGYVDQNTVLGILNYKFAGWLVRGFIFKEII